jgi:acyl dehydratase
MRMAVDSLINDTISMGSPGIDEIRWTKPVRPGDLLSGRGTVLEVTPSRSKPDRGALRIRYEIRNQRGEVVMSMIAIGIFGRRPLATR